MSESVLKSPYDERFFNQTRDASALAAAAILGRLAEMCLLGAVVDIGCGGGQWLREAERLGASRVLGVDGAHVPKSALLIEARQFHAHDLEMPLPNLGRFDLALCLEVAEHLSPRRGPSLIEDLCGCSDVILFSAAIPYQGGDGHLNEMWPEYWAAHFSRQGYKVLDSLREEFWSAKELPWWYRQNMLLFVRSNKWRSLFGDLPPSNPFSLTRIHPECYLWAARRADADFRTNYAQDVGISASAAALPVGELPGYGPEFQAPLLYGRERD